MENKCNKVISKWRQKTEIYRERVRWSWIRACGCHWYEKYFSVNSLLVMSPWLTGCARAPRGHFRRPRKQPLIWLSWHWREPFVKKFYEPHLVFSFICLSLTQAHFFPLPWLCQRFFTLKHIFSPLFEILLWRPRNLLGLGCIYKSTYFKNLTVWLYILYTNLYVKICVNWILFTI